MSLSTSKRGGEGRRSTMSGSRRASPGGGGGEGGGAVGQPASRGGEARRGLEIQGVETRTAPLVRRHYRPNSRLWDRRPPISPTGHYPVLHSPTKPLPEPPPL